MSKFGSVAKAGALAAGAGIAYGLGKVAAIGWDEFNQGQQIAAQTNAVLKSTGGVAGVTAKHVETLSAAMLRKTGIDDEATGAAQNLLLTFTQIGAKGGIFDRTTQSVADMATAMNNGAIPSQEQMSNTAITVGKALNNPIAGLGRLTRVGVEFTEQQKKQITALAEAGKTEQAQVLILRELEKEFGGSAKAAGETFAGQITKLREQFNNWAGEMVAKAIPMLQRFATWLNKEVIPAAQDMADVVRDHWPQIQKSLGRIFQGVSKLAPVFRLWLRVGVLVFTAYVKYFSLLVQGIVKVVETAARFVNYMRGPMGSALEFVRDKLALVRATAMFTFDFFRDRVVFVVDKVRLIINTLKEMVGFIRSIPGRIKDALGGIGGFFSGIASRIGDGVLSLKDLQFAPTAANPGGLVPRILDELGIAQAMGLTLTSGYRPGAITSTGNPSLHGVGQAIDVAGTKAQMTSFFRAMVGRPGIRELLYSPIGGWYGGGGIVPLSGSVLRDHFSHVHVGVADKGAWIPPRSTALLTNKTSRWEPVGPPGAGGGDTFIFHGPVLDGPKLVRLIDAEREKRRRQGGS